MKFLLLAGAGNTSLGMIARHTASTSYLRCYLLRSGSSSSSQQLVLDYLVAGSLTTLHTVSTYVTPGTYFKIRLTVLDTGYVKGELFNQYSALVSTVEGSSTDLATGGALDDGKVGLWDMNTRSSSNEGMRHYDTFYVSALPATPVVIASGRSVEFRHDTAIRQSSGGAAYGRVPDYRGSRFYLPPAGPEDRTSRVVVKANRHDLEVSPYDNLTDELTVAVFYRPRVIAVPPSA
jgi:hypothetical protein